MGDTAVELLNLKITQSATCYTQIMREKLTTRPNNDR